MAGVYKKQSDKKRGKAGKWTCWWKGADHKKHQCVGTVDRAASLEIARKRETEAMLVREGLIEARDIKARDAGKESIPSTVDSYTKYLGTTGSKPKHTKHINGVLKRLFASAAIDSTAKLAMEPIQAALKVVRDKNSARTANHARTATKAFVVWLHETDRIRDLPRWINKLETYNQDGCRKVERRALTRDEMARLLRAAEAGANYVARRPHKNKKHDIYISGSERAMAYRVAMATGLRAGEIRSLKPSDFIFGERPNIRVKGAYTKNSKPASQPMAQEIVEPLKAWLASKAPDVEVFLLPEKTAKMLRVDLAAAGIEYKVDGKVVDFHALRHSFISSLIEAGVDPKTVQILARHSTPTLTLGIYSHTTDDRKQSAVDKLLIESE